MKERSNIVSGRISTSGALTNASIEGISVSVPSAGQVRIRFPSWFRMKNITGMTEAGGSYILSMGTYLGDREVTLMQSRTGTEAIAFGGHMYFLAVGDVKT